ncbi:MAG: heat shock protein GrpE [Nitrosomonas europaea]|nr:MAG: heat shock protein GrpE [Nitrosomonas europaea]
MQESHDQESIEKQKLPGMDDVLEMDHSSAAAGNTETAGEDAAPSLEQQLKEAEIRAAEHHDAWLRAKAETENIRKRAQTDIANAHKYAVDNFSVQLLAVMDSLDAALATENSTLKICGTVWSLHASSLRQFLRNSIYTPLIRKEKNSTHISTKPCVQLNRIWRPTRSYKSCRKATCCTIG